MKLFRKKNKATRAKSRFLRNRKSTPRNEDNEDSDDWTMPRDLITFTFDSTWDDEFDEQDEVDEQHNFVVNFNVGALCDMIPAPCAQVLVILFLTVSLICCVGFAFLSSVVLLVLSTILPLCRNL